MDRRHFLSRLLVFAGAATAVAAVPGASALAAPLPEMPADLDRAADIAAEQSAEGAESAEWAQRRPRRRIRRLRRQLRRERRRRRIRRRLRNGRVVYITI